MFDDNYNHVKKKANRINLNFVYCFNNSTLWRL